MQARKIILLAGKWDTTPLVYNFLRQHFGEVDVILEEAVPKKEFLKKRIKKIGLVKVTGQVLFQLLIGKPMSKLSANRIEEIKQKYHLNSSPIPASNIIQVPSVNDPATIEKLKTLQPDLVIVHGTRIISKKLLQATNATFINIHAGITPRYRGSHGAYWALYNNDKENCGVTVHIVDAGIDTGNILAQKCIPHTKKDNFSTYGYLQLAEGLLLLKDTIDNAMRGQLKPVRNNLDSALWHHPTLWGYLYKRLLKGVK